MHKPAIILVRPQLPENIGAVVRVMTNFGFNELRVVSPREKNFIEKATPMAANGAYLLNDITIFDNLSDAISDINLLIATAGYSRHMVKPLTTPRESMPNIKGYSGKVAFIFGSERIGLTNEELNLAELVLQIKTDEKNPSMNIAQAVAVVCYEFESANPLFDNAFHPMLASKEELVYFLNNLLTRLDNKGFYKNPKMKQEMNKNIRNIFVRSSLTSQDIKTLHGIFRTLSDGNW